MAWIVSVSNTHLQPHQTQRQGPTHVAAAARQVYLAQTQDIRADLIDNFSQIFQLQAVAFTGHIFFPANQVIIVPGPGVVYQIKEVFNIPEG